MRYVCPLCLGKGKLPPLEEDVENGAPLTWVPCSLCVERGFPPQVFVKGAPQACDMQTDVRPIDLPPSTTVITKVQP